MAGARARAASVRERLRGWGGVTGMAVVCALTASLTLSGTWTIATS